MQTKKHTFIILTILYFSLIGGFYLNEDLIGGAFVDYGGHFHISEKFKENFSYTLLNYSELGHRHSPLFYILRSMINLDEVLQRLLFLHIFLLIPLFFYKCLKIIFYDTPKDLLKLLAFIILLFPTFRSYSIWPDPHLLGSLFFLISIYYFLKFKIKDKPLKNSLFNIFFLAVSAYISPNFSLFAIYFFYEYFLKFKLSKNLIIVTLFNILLSLPIFFYLFILDINFIFDNKGWDIGDNFFSLQNFSNKVVIITSLFFFYLLPFLLLKKIEINNLFKLDIITFLWFLVFIFSCYLFDFSYAFNLTNSGGGIFYQLSNKIFGNNAFLFLIGLVSSVFIGQLFRYNYKNLIIFLCLILSNPQVTMWQSNFSPTIFFLIFLLTDHDLKKNRFYFKQVFVIYLYFLLYLGANLAKILLI